MPGHVMASDYLCDAIIVRARVNITPAQPFSDARRRVPEYACQNRWFGGTTLRAWRASCTGRPATVRLRRACRHPYAARSPVTGSNLPVLSEDLRRLGNQRSRCGSPARWRTGTPNGKTGQGHTSRHRDQRQPRQNDRYGEPADGPCDERSLRRSAGPTRTGLAHAAFSRQKV